MTQSTKPVPRLAPLPIDHDPELSESFQATARRMGFMPNSMLIMQRKPKIVKAFAALGQAIRGADTEVDHGFLSLLGHMASRAAGCRYCQAHTASSTIKGGSQEKLEAIWEYRTSPLFSEAERVALDFALAAGSVPNDVSDDMFANMRKHWTENQIVEIVALISYFGFLNRWNDTMGTPLEEEPIEVAEQFLAPHGWTAGKHG